MAKRVHISRQGSIDVTNEMLLVRFTLNRPIWLTIAALKSTRDLLNENEDGFRGTATFRDRAKMQSSGLYHQVVNSHLGSVAVVTLRLWAKKA